MRFSANFLEDLRARLPVSQIVGRRVKLKKAGREWRGLSPFNAEKTPSFYVNDQKMAWFDFSSGRNGNIFDFIMATEGVSFPEAVERLAAEAGLDLPSRTPDDVRRDQARAGLIEACEWAADYFQAALQKREGSAARAYLAQRGLGSSIQAEFRLGYAPGEKYALRDHLAGRGVSAAVMAEAGLLIHGDDIAVPYDRFRNRIMFPICDRNGRVIAFGGRALDKDVPAKYLNSPETPLFHKGAVLYNHHRARKPAADRESVVAVEGYMDAIAMAGAGFPNVVAQLGTALTPDQCDLLWRMAPEPILCFDGDGAGRRAAFKAIDTGLPLISAGRSLRFAFLPDGQDPDDLVRSGGQTALTACLDSAKPLVDVLWLRETEGTTLDTPERRAGLERRLGEICRSIGDETLRRHYEAELRMRLRDLTGFARNGFGRRDQQAPLRRGGRPWRPGPEPVRGLLGAPVQASSVTVTQHPPLGRREVEIAALILNHPSLLDWHAEDLAHVDFASPDIARLRDGLLMCLSNHIAEPDALARALDEEGYEACRKRVVAAAERIASWWLKPDASASDADQILRQALTLHRKSGTLHKALRAAEVALAQDPCDQNLDALRDIKAQLFALEGTEASLDGFGALSGRQQTDV